MSRAAALLALALSGCGEAVPPRDATEAQSPARAVGTGPAPAFLDPGERDPRRVLAGWAAALGRRDWSEARRAWGGHGEASGMTAQDFARRWEQYRTIAVTFGEGRVEGAAGSLYYEAPVTVAGKRQDDSAYGLEGAITLRRANAVPGATPEQLRWHIERTTLAF